MSFLYDMQISNLNCQYSKSTTIKPNFKAKGKPISLQYIVEKRSYFLPERILNKAKEILTVSPNKIPSLMELHKSTYAPILECKTLDEVKKLFPEFKDIKPKVKFLRESVYTKSFNSKISDNFVLDTLKAYWGRLETLGEIARSLGMKTHSSIERALLRINFIPYDKNYRVLLNASDQEGNKIIASKTTAWNQAHPEKMYEHNKKAAQMCKTDEYRTAQAKRIKDFYKTNPERREKLSEALRMSWQNCPEIKEAMSEFLKQESIFTKHSICKRAQGKKLTSDEKKAAYGFYKRFWEAHPELKAIYAEARKGYKIKD